MNALLTKVATLLQTEPARAIGYGAAVVVYLVIMVLNARGITRFGENLSFEEALTATLGAIATVITVVESIRKFVFSPQTYIEDLADENELGHQQAHAEEDMRAFMADLVAQVNEQERAEKVVKPRRATVAVGPAPVVDPDKQN